MSRCVGFPSVVAVSGYGGSVVLPIASCRSLLVGFHLEFSSIFATLCFLHNCATLLSCAVLCDALFASSLWSPLCLPVVVAPLLLLLFLLPCCCYLLICCVVLDGFHAADTRGKISHVASLDWYDLV
jgi:NADH:ubiquinone oxidoreductase subunit H